MFLGRLSRELSPNAANTSAAVAAAAAAAASQSQSSQQQSSHIHRPFAAQALANHGSPEFSQTHIRSRSTSPPSKQINQPARSPEPVSPNPLQKRFENDEDVDVEQCSDGEDERSHNGDPKSSSNGIPQSRSPGAPLSSNNNNDERASGRDSSSSTTHLPKKKDKDKVRIMKAKCNCEELKYVDCFLETKELWDKFNDLGTEMIITKTGR